MKCLRDPKVKHGVVCYWSLYYIVINFQLKGFIYNLIHGFLTRLVQKDFLKTGINFLFCFFLRVSISRKCFYCYFSIRKVQHSYSSGLRLSLLVTSSSVRQLSTNCIINMLSMKSRRYGRYTGQLLAPAEGFGFQ